jgi:peptidoglycan/xylan/chitin deacetylase (PgdA/CDA1 family)
MRPLFLSVRRLPSATAAAALRAWASHSPRWARGGVPRGLHLVSMATLLTVAIVDEPYRAQSATAWPGGARMALSLSFDDGRESQVREGLPVFARHGAKVTLFVVPSAIEPRLDGWKRAVAAGHEIGNHSLTHSCSGNFPFSRQKALEDHTIPRMREELAEANRRIAALLGVTPRTFAYPCGQTFVGRGRATQSYVPVVAELFLAGRGWLDEAANDPAFVDLAQTLGVEMDGKDFAQIRPLLDDARTRGAWLVLAGHDIGAGGRQTTRVAMLDELLAYVKDPSNGIWLATVSEAADAISSQASAVRQAR